MIYLDDILESTKGRVCGQAFAREFTDFCYDSRILKPGELFLAVKTEKADGHDYIEEVCQDGAAGVLCQAEMDLSRYGVTCIQVDDTQRALTQWARHVLSNSRTEVIGVTGSTGKTSSKEAIAAVLRRRFRVFKNFGNYNDRYGLPIALGRLLPEHEKAVLEMACDSFGEIEDLSRMTSPRVGVVTTVNHTHLEYLGTLDNIAQEEGRLVEALPEEGYAILNYDDPRVRAMIDRTAAQVITYGTSPGADVRGSAIEGTQEGIQFQIHHQGAEYEAAVSLLGKHSVYTALAAAAVGIAYGVGWEDTLEALSCLQRMKGRLNPLPGINGSLLLDDTFSASPASTLAALDVLEELEGEKKFAILGDMLRLGNYEEEGHREVGRRVAEVADVLVTKGDRARLIASEAQRSGLGPDRVFITYGTEDTVRSVMNMIDPRDVVLIKGALETRMEEVVEKLLADPTSAESVLVRQSPAWKQIYIIRPDRPTWVEIDLGAIANNVRQLKRMVGDRVGIIATLKADAYGHGAIKVARTALTNGVDVLGVACLSEAVTLRRADITAPILILGYTPAWQAREAVLNDVTVTVFSLDVAKALSRAADDLNSEVRVHVKVDTGMGRLGILPHEVLDFVREVKDLSGLVVEGIFTHLAIADIPDAHKVPGWGREYTRKQLRSFQDVLQELEANGVHIPHIHAANSAAIIDFPESHFNMVRPGIAIYGLDPSSQVPRPAGFEPALSLKSQVAQVKELPSGSYVSYGCTYRTEGRTRIAVIPVGYADGFRRGPHDWGEVLVKGRRAPLVGSVCMDQSMIDVTDIPGVRQGDEVVLIGQQGGDRITVGEVAERLGTINYEVVSEILARVPRVT
ncbi:MAG: alanine racemase [Anaerolineae bacterium]